MTMFEAQLVAADLYKNISFIHFKVESGHSKTNIHDPGIAFV